MIDNVALNVVIGLVFIYLLYSLFATVISEIIATYIGLRARTLKEAVDRMLNDENEEQRGFLFRLWDSFKLMKNPTNARVTNFYNHPEIKYLGSTGIFKVPSQFRSVSFSKTLMVLLNETGYKKLRMGDNTQMRDPEEGDIKDVPVTNVTKEQVEAALLGVIQDHKTLTGYEKEKIVLDEETAKYVLALYRESYGDLVKFRLHLEAWFDRTMEQCTEWYKRKIQVVLLVLGFMLAWFFNADTFTIVRKLSTDKDAREKLVTLAAAYIEANPQRPDSLRLNLTSAQLDSLFDMKAKLEADIANANSILGSGGWLPDSAKVVLDSNRLITRYIPELEKAHIDKGTADVKDGYVRFNSRDKWNYLGSLFLPHFFGFLLTAIAVSLGAPFWFDLLNKLMKLRTSKKQDTDSTNITGTAGISPLNRVG